MPIFNLTGKQSFREGNRKSPDDSSSEKSALLPESKSVSAQQKSRQINQANSDQESPSQLDFSPHHPLEHPGKDPKHRDTLLPENKSPAYIEIPNLFPVEIPFLSIEEIREKKEKKSEKPPVSSSKAVNKEEKKSERPAILQPVQMEPTIISNPVPTTEHADSGTANNTESHQSNEILPPLEFVPDKKHHGFMKYILPVLVLLCAAVMIYYLGLIPGYTRLVDHLLGKTKGIPSNQIKEPVVQREAQSTPTKPPALNYNYFIQVSSWEQQYLADREKEKFLKKNISALVETEFIAKKKRTHYRVRIGPFPSRAEAQKVKMQIAGMIPRDAFIDSTFSYEKNVPSEKVSTKPVNSDLKKEQPSTGKALEKKSTIEQQIQKTAQLKPVPKMRAGYIVAVSSFKQKSLADQEAKNLLAKGYSAFVQQTHSGSSDWYRVQVGPFTSQDQAKKYLQLIRATFGNDAYIIDLSLE